MLLRLGSVFLLIYSFVLVHDAVPKLPPRIPVHFNAAGRPDGWGSPGTLWLLFGVQLGMTLLFFAVPWVTSRFRAGRIGRRRLSQLPPEQRAQVAGILRRMFDIDALLINGLFALICRWHIAAAFAPGSLLPTWPLPFLLGGMVVSSFYYTWKLYQFNRALNKSLLTSDK